MLSKDEIIKNALLSLGENTIYNDNKKEIYKICEIELEKVTDNIAYSTGFLFNATTVELTENGKVGDEIKYNMPVDCLNIIRGFGEWRRESEYIYSTEKKLKIQYCRKIPLNEFPDELFNLVVAMLCREMCLTFSTYNKKLEFFDSECLRLKNSIVSQQGFQYMGD